MMSEQAAVPLCASSIVSVFDDLFLQEENTCLRGGAEEPFYQAARRSEPSVIFFRADYVRSALHEVAHWCVAGSHRRQLDDYGYWYSADDRDLERQRAFFAVEALPQAIERHFCEALGIDFEPSLDNLRIVVPPSDIQQFVERLNVRYQRFLEQGLPERAHRFRQGLRRRCMPQSPADAA